MRRHIVHALSAVAAAGGAAILTLGLAGPAAASAKVSMLRAAADGTSRRIRCLQAWADPRMGTSG